MKNWAQPILQHFKCTNPFQKNFNNVFKSLKRIFKPKCCSPKVNCFENCKNLMKLINNFSFHFQKLRSLKKRLYELRINFLSVLKIKKLLKSSSYIGIQNYNGSNKKTVKIIF